MRGLQDSRVIDISHESDILPFSLVLLKYFSCRLMVRQLRSIVQNLVVNYHVVVSYPQEWHIGINVNQ